jgi:hypothetical protein
MRAFGHPEADCNDQRVAALNYILEAWDEGTATGIASELMAYAAIFTALTDLVAAFGEDSVVALINGLAPRVRKGEFTLTRGRRLA